MVLFLSLSVDVDLGCFSLTWLEASNILLSTDF